VSTAAVVVRAGRATAAARADEWVGWLGDRLDVSWRPGEWNPRLWLFRGDPDSSKTRVYRCATPGCPNLTRLSKRRRCSACHERSRAVADAALATPSHPRYESRRAVGAVDHCLVASCDQASDADGLCRWHCARRARARDVPFERWAAIADPWISLADFWLGGLPMVLRHELLFGLQQRDQRPSQLDPSGVRRAVARLLGEPVHGGRASLTGLALGQLRVRWAGADHGTRALMLEIAHYVKFEHDRFASVDPTAGEVWNTWQFGLPVRRGESRRVAKGFVDFGGIRQDWMRDLTKVWVVQTVPTVEAAQRAVRAMRVASEGLALRPGNGEDRTRLGTADMAAVFVALRDAHLDDGTLASVRTRQRLVTNFFHVIDFGRRSDLLADVPGGFARLREHVIRDVEVNEDHLGRAVPEEIIGCLDRHVDLLGVCNADRLPVDAETLATMYGVVYRVMRDTGRRANEYLSLGRSCVEWIDGHPNLVYDNHKARRLRRRLPITTDLAEAIIAWETQLGALQWRDGERWLFPSPRATFFGHLGYAAWNSALQRWVDAIVAADGTGSELVAENRAKILPHAFRHAYAQRHADAGVAVDVLRDLLDHKSSATTLGYYRVTLRRKRDAIKLVGRFSMDRHGHPAPITDVRSYEIGTVAVPFGNCTEPSNVKAGGHACPIRFQCAGCGSYRPDPSYLPAVEQHVHQLRVDRETAVAVGVAPFVVDNLAAQVDAFTAVAVAMRGRLEALGPGERAEVEEAARVLRRARAARSSLSDADQGRLQDV
jgi:integrase